MKDFVHGYLACARDSRLDLEHDTLLKALRRRYSEENAINLAADLGSVLLELEKEGHLKKTTAGQL